MTISLFKTGDILNKLQQGSSIVFPTDTLPALATLPKYSYQLWEIKNRPRTKPLILMASSSEELFNFVLDKAVNDAVDMARIYWPGPLTMVLPSLIQPLENLNPGGNSIGMRVPACALSKKLLFQSGPLATTSANVSGEKPLLFPKDISMKFPEIPILGPTPWPELSGMASTVISWKGPGNWHLLRRGAVIPKMLER